MFKVAYAPRVGRQDQYIIGIWASFCACKKVMHRVIFDVIRRRVAGRARLPTCVPCANAKSEWDCDQFKRVRAYATMSKARIVMKLCDK